LISAAARHGFLKAELMLGQMLLDGLDSIAIGIELTGTAGSNRNARSAE
jgi:hypothetical protein